MTRKCFWYTARKKVHIEEAWIERICADDKDAFTKLYEASYRSLYAFLLSLTQNAEDAQDLLQDTFIQIYNNASKYKRQGNPMAWMMTIARNLFLMKYRKDHNVETVNYEELEQQIGYSQIENVEDKLLVEAIFKMVDPEDREILILHIVAGLKFAEIGKIMQKPMGTIFTRYNRCIKKLQKDLSKR